MCIAHKNWAKNWSKKQMFIMDCSISRNVFQASLLSINLGVICGRESDMKRFSDPALAKLCLCIYVLEFINSLHQHRGGIAIEIA